MRSQLLINTGLLLFVVIAASVLWFDDNDDSAEEAIVELTDLKAEQVQRIQIENLSGKTIRFELKNQHWWMTEPYQVRANPSRIEAMLDMLSAVSFDQLNINEVEADKFELQPANASLTFNDEVFHFGDVNPLSEFRYVEYKQQIHLLTDGIYHQISANPTFFIEPKILPDVEKVQAIRTPDYVITVAEDEWQLSSDTLEQATLINTIIESWKMLEAITILPLAFDQAENTIVIESEGEADKVFMVKPNSPDLVLGHTESGLEFHVAEYMAERLFPIVVTAAEEE